MPMSFRAYDFFQRLLTRALPYPNVPAPSGDSIESYLASRQLPPTCPKCGGTRLVRNGKSASRQRFRCKDCGKSCGWTSGTPFHRSRKPQSTWNAVLRNFEARTPLREIAEQCGISLPTASKWRQRYIENHIEVFKEFVAKLAEAGILPGDTDVDELLQPLKPVVVKHFRGRSKTQPLKQFLRKQMHILEKIERQQHLT